jgi:hypothetical protein
MKSMIIIQSIGIVLKMKNRKRKENSLRDENCVHGMFQIIKHFEIIRIKTRILFTKD